MPSSSPVDLSVNDFSGGRSGIPSSIMPSTFDLFTSQWQPTNVVDPDQNVSIFRDFSHQLSDSCAYYSDDSVSEKLLKSFPNAFSLMHYNVRGIISSYTEIESFLASKSITIVGFCETFLRPDNCDLYPFTGYHVVHKPRSNGQRGGGVSLLINEALSFNERNDLSSLLSHAESLFIEIPSKFMKSKKNVIVGEIYRPPNGNKASFVNEIENLLSSISNYECYLMGDFNIDLMVCDNDADSINYSNCFNRYCFYPLVNRPTRLASATLLDHIFTNSCQFLGDGHFFSAIVLIDLSDHLPIIHAWNTSPMPEKETHSTFKYQLINERSISALKEKLREIDWSDLLLIEDVNVFYERFHNRLSQVYFKHIPVIQKKNKAQHKPWITASLRKSINEKNKLYSQSVKYPCQYSRERYRNYKNRLNHLLRASERNYAREQFQKYSSNLKNQWRVINNLIERKQRPPLPSTMRLNADSDSISNPQLIADEMNSFFVNSGISVIGHNPPSATDPLSLIPDLCDLHMMYAAPSNEREIIKIIESLKNSSAGSDQLKPKVIKEVKSELLKPVLHLVNLSLKSGVFPEKLKEALITPVFKKGCKDLVGNYRPISVLSVFSKILEKIMYKRLLGYLDSTRILYERQFGFRKGRSTEMAVTEAVSIITRALNDKDSILAVNMDLSKAFDTINHDILCKKLGKYGISGNLLKWFVSYLSNRKQSVRYGNTLSSEQVIQCGVPQGSNLGPLLFILYINDLHLISDACDAILYADDCNLFFRFKRSNSNIDNQINNTLHAFSDWFSCNQLALNTAKTNYMVFSGRRRTQINGITINGTELNQVAQCHFLGLIIDQTLSWKPHVQATCRKLAKSIGILRKISNKLSKALMLQLYNSFVLPYIQYGITLWGASSNASIDSIYVMQKKALKVALCLPLRTSTEELFRNSKIRPVRELYTLYVSLFMYKFHRSQLPTCFDNYFEQNSIHHEHNTRSAGLYRLPLFSTKNCQQSILFKGPKIWSNIPDRIRQSSSLRTFKCRMRVYLADPQDPQDA